ncbi:MAG: HEAT repeat domain-containing protein [Candidatus Riflebacteria bacterium]|nr:HEAT repeat domain-containing protein [Candidatus Riflebacteria bacterium]
MSDEINFDRITELLDSSVAKERQQGIVLAVRGALRQLISRITEIAGSDADEETRFIARKALERFAQEQASSPEDAEYSELSVEQLLDHEDPHARFAGLKMLLAEKSRTGRLLLLNALNAETVLQLKASMIIGLGRFANPDDVSVLAPYLKNEDARIRANSIEALALIESEDAYRCIISCMSDSDNRVKTNVVKALQGIGGQSLFNLLKKMSQDNKLWTRASAVYAFYRIKSPQSLVALAQMSISDPEPEIRKRALEYIQSEKNDGNPAAAVVLEKLEQSRSHEEFVAAMPDEHSEEASDNEIAGLLTSDDAARRYIALSKINSIDATEYTDLFLGAFRDEQDSFLLSMMLTMVREKKLAGAYERCCELLTHGDDRVRANAVEAVVSAMSENRSLDCLLPLLKDKYSRVVGNAILALHSQNRVDLVVELKGMLKNGREAFKRSALYVMSQLREPILVPIVEKMLHDHNPRVRDRAFEILHDYADARVTGAVILLQQVKKQVELEKSKAKFFENSLDKVFAGVLRLLRSIGGDSELDSERKLFERNPQAEKQSLLQLGQKCLQHKIVDDRTLESLTAIETELKHVEELIKAAGLENSDGTVNEDARQKSEQELLKIEQMSLMARRESVLTFLAFEVYSNRAHLDTKSSSLLMADLGRVDANIISYIPQHGFSMLPEEEAGVSEYFDVAMRLYQKHVAAFSIYTLMQFFRWVLMGFLLFIVFALSASLHKIFGVFFGLLFVPYISYKTLGLMVEWKINIALMVDDCIHGRDYNKERIRDKAGELYLSVFTLSLKKHLLLGLWFIIALIMSGTVFAAGSVTSTYTIVTDLSNMLAMLLLIFVFASVYFKYLLVEVAAVFEPARDAFETAQMLFLRDRGKLIMLFIFSTFIIQLVTGTSVEIVSLVSNALPAVVGVILVVGISFISDMCLTPIVFSTLCIYSLVNLKKIR